MPLLPIALFFSLALVGCDVPTESAFDFNGEKADQAAELVWETSVSLEIDAISFDGTTTDGEHQVEITVMRAGRQARFEVYMPGDQAGVLDLNSTTMTIGKNTLPAEKITANHLWAITRYLAATGERSDSSYRPTHNECLASEPLLDWLPRTCAELAETTLKVGSLGVLVGAADLSDPLPDFSPPVVSTLKRALGVETKSGKGVAAMASVIDDMSAKCSVGSTAKLYWCE